MRYPIFSLLPHPLTNIPHHLRRHIELRGALKAFEIGLAVDFEYQRLVALEADVHGGEFAAQGAGGAFRKGLEGRELAQLVTDKPTTDGVVGAEVAFGRFAADHDRQGTVTDHHHAVVFGGGEVFLQHQLAVGIMPQAAV